MMEESVTAVNGAASTSVGAAGVRNQAAGGPYCVTRGKGCGMRSSNSPMVMLSGDQGMGNS
ncbi:MAG: hypothetical protein KF716_21140 [Anaerolineae bacterium]|nr:hypothetical protein [Anaerolineae bacterium]